MGGETTTTGAAVAAPLRLERSVGALGVLGQSVAGVAPSTTPTINIPLVFAAAGSASWLAYLIAMAVVLLVALNLVPFARRFAGAGSLSEFVAHGLGPHGRLVTAWALLIAYLAVPVATLAGCAGYLQAIFEAAGLAVPTVVLVAVAGVGAAALALRDVRLSTVLMLALEGVSMLLVTLLGLAVLARQGLDVDLSQFTLEGVSWTGMNSALLIGVLSFVGFEATATLGAEARRPLVDIPRTLIVSPLVTGLFFVFSAYVLVLGFNRYGIDAAHAAAPLENLARALALPGLGLLVSVGAAVSLFTCVVATLVASSRVAYALARQGALPALLGRLDPRHDAPTTAVWVAVAICLAASFAFALFAAPLDVYDWLGTFSTFGCILAYGLTAVAMPVFMRREGTLRAWHIAVAALALAVLAYVLYGSVWPVPAAPFNLLPWLFLALLAIGVGWSALRLRQARPA
jgi:amino acid transporter